MTSILIFVKSWKWTVKNWRLCLLLYTANVVFALLLALPFFEALDQHLGDSMLANRLLDGFDYTVFSDFMAHYGISLSGILSQLKLFLILFYLLSVYLTGGILRHFRDNPFKFNLGQFINHCNKYFWRLLQVSLTFITLIGLLAGLLFKLFLIINKNGNLAQLPSDSYFFKWFICTGVIFFWGATLLLMWHDYAKVQLVHKQTNWWKSLKASFVIAFKNFRRTFSLYVIYLALFGLIALIYYLVRQLTPENTSIGILLLLIFAQLFVFMRLSMRILNLAGTTLMFQKITKP